MTVLTPHTYILTDCYFDSWRADFVRGSHAIKVDPTHGLILGVLKWPEESEISPNDANVTDLRGLTVLPGFVDTHVHFFLHPYSEASWDDQVTRESVTERTVRAVNHARATLLAGFTTVRDLGTEGAGDADIALRKCISSPVSLIPGPRYFCASRAIVSTGSYGPKNDINPSRQGVDGITAAQAADGPDDCMRVVRQQVGAGVDWIKVYAANTFSADYSHRSLASQTSPRAGSKYIPLWTQPEWESLVNTAHSLGVKVAVHANTAEGALAALAAGVNTIEHGNTFNEDVLAQIRTQRTIWTPTLAAYHTLYPGGPKWERLKGVFQTALRENEKAEAGDYLSEGIMIATGGDTGTFAHGKNALELQLMHSLGMSTRRVLQAATFVGWRCVRGIEWEGPGGAKRVTDQKKNMEPMGDNEIGFGCLERGFAADIIATSGDLVGNGEKGFADAVNCYFESWGAKFVRGGHAIKIDPTHGLILGVTKWPEKSEISPNDTNVTDLRGLTVLPGFVDTHVHFFLHPYSEASWTDQVTRESITERTVRAVNHARATLLAGFTTVRDLGTEGAGDADIALRKCISSPVSLIPGPRYFCASRAIVSTGSYGPKSDINPNEQGVNGITGAQVADGPDDCMRVVRQQVGAGVDWIKVYADYSHRSRASQTSPRAGPKYVPLWTQPEWQSLVSTAHSLGVKVAVHATTAQGALAALAAGANSIEHGHEINEDVLAQLRERRAVWTPTLSVYHTLDPGGPKWEKLKLVFQSVLKENEKAVDYLKEGVMIACGGDTGTFAHGKNALELQLMHSLGMPAHRVLQAATFIGWRCVRGMEWDGPEGLELVKAQRDNAEPMGDNEMRFGYIERGSAADIIATSGDLVGNGEKGFADAVGADKIVFVMKLAMVGYGVGVDFDIQQAFEKERRTNFRAKHIAPGAFHTPDTCKRPQAPVFARAAF
ncbi:hypothetical protein BDV93DRAFT_543103 [Ceratobasidium sp. AG-I]|nr:hypothetical protein BDV93DRAFT_543103 [Ceratobasidium sp. AG-I]